MESQSIATISCEKSNVRDKQECLKQLFNRIFSGNQTVCIKGRRKTGKSRLVMEMIAQSLLNDRKKEVLYLSTFGNFNAAAFVEICKSYRSDESKDNLLKRLKIVDIETENDFNDYVSCLEALTLGLQNITLIAVDSLSFYHHSAFIFEKVFKKELTLEMYHNHYKHIFSSIVNQRNISIIYTLPEHLVAEYAKRNINDFEDEERIIYEHIKAKSEGNVDENYSKLSTEDDDMCQIRLCPDEHERFIPGYEEKGIMRAPECTSAKVEAIEPAVIKGIGSIEIKAHPQSEDIPKGGTSSTRKDDDSLSDNCSVESGEGYKSESGTEESCNAIDKIPEKVINAMHKEIHPDITVKLINISANNYIMQIKSDHEEFDINFDITENGLEFEDIPAEKQL